MTTRDELTKVRDRLWTNLKTVVDRVVLFGGDIGDSIAAGVPLSGTTGFTVLVGIRQQTPATRYADNRVKMQVSEFFVTLIKAHTGKSDYEEELLSLLDLVDTVRGIMWDTATPPWWSDQGFTALQENTLTNLSDPDLNFSAFEIEYQFGVCQTYA